jgi:hypothetical protein
MLRIYYWGNVGRGADFDLIFSDGAPGDSPNHLILENVILSEAEIPRS